MLLLHLPISEDYLTVRTNTQLYYNSFLPSVVREWNSLPHSSRNAATLESFKMSLNMDTVNKLPYYYIGERLGQIYHARLRTQCSSLNEPLFWKGISTETNCVCGAVETTKHFLLECTAFNEFRQEMFNEIRSFCIPTLDYYLYGWDAPSDQHNSGIFKSVQKFIIRSKRFSSAN